MLSYKHIFHAGNFADVLKHLVLQRVVLYLGKKEAPYSLVDTHSGAGLYALQHAQAQKNQEFNSGIGKLWRQQDLPGVLKDYLKLIKQFNPTPQLTQYPGSPLIMQHYLRGKDRLFLHELHPNEFTALQRVIKQDRHVQVQNVDGLAAALKLLPPAERRALVFIDPSCEIKTDYAQVVRILKQMQQRFATGTYVLWYPVIQRERNQAMEQALKSSGIRNIQLFELAIDNDSAEAGMTASGLIVINPPWTLMAEMQAVLPFLAKHLGKPGLGRFRAEQLVAE